MAEDSVTERPMMLMNLCTLGIEGKVDGTILKKLSHREERHLQKRHQQDARRTMKVYCITVLSDRWLIIEIMTAGNYEVACLRSDLQD